MRAARLTSWSLVLSAAALGGCSTESAVGREGGADTEAVGAGSADAGAGRRTAGEAGANAGSTSAGIGVTSTEQTPATTSSGGFDAGVSDFGSPGLPAQAECFETPEGAAGLAPAEGPLQVELGTRDPATGIDFLPLDDQCALPIGGVGQAGLTARLALRVRGGEGPVQRATVSVVLVNFMDEERDPAPSGGPTVVRSFDCRDDGWCYQVPILVEISHLARLPELEGTRVTFQATVTQEQDANVRGTVSGWGRFVLDAAEK